jgi:hypothetical protein
VTAVDPKTALSGISAGLRSELLESFALIVRNYQERRWEPSELNGGKLCEVVHSILAGYIGGNMPDRASKPRNMVDACKVLENADATRFPRSVRIQIPRLLVALYEVRNNRGVGHVGGDVDPNGMDARLVLETAKWVVAELVRVFHGITTDSATDLVEKLTERTLPIVWQAEDVKRVLNPSLSMREQTLLLLYASQGQVSESLLVSWTEHSSASVYRRDILRKLHQQRLIEYTESKRVARLTPLGSDYVERHLPLTL